MAKSTKSTSYKKKESKTDYKKRLFIERYFPTTGNISVICRELKIDRGTYYQWMKKDEKFRKAIEDEQEGLIDFVESKAFNLINEKNPTMIIFFLKTKAKHRGYIERMEYDHSGIVKTDNELVIKVVQVDGVGAPAEEAEEAKDK